MATPNAVPQNYFSTSLSAPITASDTTVYLNLLPTATEGWLEIDEGTASKEIVYYTSKGANFVTLPSVGAGRGVGGTTAASHTTGATVKMKLNAEWWKALQDGSALAVTALSPAKTANPYKFRAYRNSALNTTAGSFAKVPFDTENFDTGSNFDSTTNNRFTAPVSGFYQFQARCEFVSTSSQFLIALYKNGSAVSYGVDVKQNASTTGVLVSDFVQLAATDYIEVFVFSNSTVAYTTGSISTYFSGYMVSAT